MEFLTGEEIRRQRRTVDIVTPLVTLLTVVMVVFLLFNALVTVCTVEGNSMNDTLSHRETILIERHYLRLKHGDIVTIGGLSDDLIIKRVIGLAGDRIVFRQSPIVAGRVEVFRSSGGSGYQLLIENYIRAPMTTYGWGLGGSRKIFKESFRLAPSSASGSGLDEYAIIVGSGQCFVMGDNREDSSDSRVYGLGRTSEIIGKMFYRVERDSLFEKLLLFIYREKK